MKINKSALDTTVKFKELHPDRGVLEVSGQLDLSQFWPSGSSDADTAHVNVDMSVNPFKFRQTLNDPPQATHAFDNAWVLGRQGAKQAIHGIKQNTPFLIIRFQGIDAPELHYQPVEKGTADFRQVLGETCTVKLAENIKDGSAPSTVPCTVVTAVNHPGDVFDTYGRFIGDILINQNGNTVNLNHWLVEKGWAYPTYYDSMTVKEITAFDALLAKSKQNAAGVYAHLSADIKDLDWHLLFRRGGPIQQEPAGKNTLMPKIFRRLATWSVKKKNGSTQDSFIAYVKSLPKDQNQCILTSDFKQGTRKLTSLETFLHANADNGQFDKVPEELVFVEAPSKLFDQQQGGKEITKWF